MRNPFDIIIRRHVTEKTTMLEQLCQSQPNKKKSLARCESPKYVLIVDKNANKQEIAEAVREIYREQNIKVVAVNTITTKGKKKRRGKGRVGRSPSFKKAIVTLEAGDVLGEALPNK